MTKINVYFQVTDYDCTLTVIPRALIFGSMLTVWTYSLLAGLKRMVTN